jgi:hypothetical protein
MAKQVAKWLLGSQITGRLRFFGTIGTEGTRPSRPDYLQQNVVRCFNHVVHHEAQPERDQNKQRRHISKTIHLHEKLFALNRTNQVCARGYLLRGVDVVHEQSVVKVEAVLACVVNLQNDQKPRSRQLSHRTSFLSLSWFGSALLPILSMEFHFRFRLRLGL